MNGEVAVREVRNRRDLDAFLRVPFSVHADDPNWIPPLFFERRQFLDRTRNPYFDHAEAVFWLAERNGAPVGRISAQVDRLAPPGVGHFGMVSAHDDSQVVAALMAGVEEWLREKNCSVVTGPFNLSINQECGLLVDGFGTPPSMMMPHDPAYLGPMLEGLDYRKATDLYAFEYDTDSGLAEKVARLKERAFSRRLRIRCLDMKNYRAEIQTLTDIFNDAWSGNWGFVPFTAAEVEHLAREMRLLIHPRLVWFAEMDGEPIAFAVCLPNINEAIRDLGGRLVPFGWAKLLWRLKVRRPRSARLPLMGLRRRFSGTPAGSLAPFLIIAALLSEGKAMGFTMAELSWVLEGNAASIQLIEAAGGRRYKTYRLYEKPL